MAAALRESSSTDPISTRESTSWLRWEPHRIATRSIAVVNGKGGCGKTTTAVNLAACLAAEGSRTLIVDVDPQGHASEAVGVDPRAAESTLFDVLVETDHADMLDGAIVRVDDRLDLLPGGVTLSVLEQRFRRDRPEQCSALLARVLSRVADRYDYIVIDSPPSVGLLTFMAIRAAREVVIPLETSSFAVGAVTRLLETLEILCDRIEHTLETRIVPTLFDGRTRFARSTLAEIRELVGEHCFDTVIRRNVRLAESAKRGVPVHRYAPNSNGAVDYASLTAEIQAYGARDLEAGLLVERGESSSPRLSFQPEAPTFVRSSSPKPIAERAAPAGGPGSG